MIQSNGDSRSLSSTSDSTALNATVHVASMPFPTPTQLGSVDGSNTMALLELSLLPTAGVPTCTSSCAATAGGDRRPLLRHGLRRRGCLCSGDGDRDRLRRRLLRERCIAFCRLALRRRSGVRALGGDGGLQDGLLLRWRRCGGAFAGMASATAAELAATASLSSSNVATRSHSLC